MPQQPPATEQHVLSLERLIAASPAQLYRAWTEPELLKQWFCPAPWRVTHAELDVRVGGLTRYTAQVAHWHAADQAEHEAMGFHKGWGKATDQLTELVSKATRPS